MYMKVHVLYNLPTEGRAVIGCGGYHATAAAAGSNSSIQVLRTLNTVARFVQFIGHRT